MTDFKPPVMTRMVKQALANKHKSDFFITECKDGPTWFGPHLRVDALAIKKSWSPVRVMAYEVKVTRGDFLSDDKYLGYLEMCHELSLVCPKGLIAPNEVPEGVGLAYYYPESGKIITKTKAKYRNIELSASTLLYIIMNRLDSDRYPFFGNKQAYFQEWLKSKKADNQLGREVGRALREVIWEAQETQRRLDRAERKRSEDASEIRKIKNLLASRGLNTWNPAQTIADLLDGKATIGAELFNAIDRLKAEADRLRRTIKEETI